MINLAHFFIWASGRRKKAEVAVKKINGAVSVMGISSKLVYSEIVSVWCVV